MNLEGPIGSEDPKLTVDFGVELSLENTSMKIFSQMRTGVISKPRVNEEHSSFRKLKLY